jgi:hypothetical protein
VLAVGSFDRRGLQAGNIGASESERAWGCLISAPQSLQIVAKTHASVMARQMIFLLQW